MSKNERVVSDPAAAGWEFDVDTGYWMWKGEEGTGGGLWEENGDDIYYNKGKVSIGTGSGGSSHPYTKLLVESDEHAAIQISTPSSREQALWFSDEDATAAGGIAYNHSADAMSFRVNDDVRMTVDADGNVGIGVESVDNEHKFQTIGPVRFSRAGSSSYHVSISSTGAGHSFTASGENKGLTFANADDGDGTISFKHTSSDTRSLKLSKNGDGSFTGTVSASNLTRNGIPVVDAKGLIKTLTTLRKATMDETQDIRESLRAAIDELVDGFEQEIAAMPAPEPEVGTMDIKQ